MKWKGFGRKRSLPNFKVSSRHSPGWTEKPRKISIRIAGRWDGDFNRRPPEYVDQLSQYELYGLWWTTLVISMLIMLRILYFTFPGVKRGRGVTLTTHPHLVPRSWMSRSYASSPPSVSMACSGTALRCFFCYFSLLNVYFSTFDSFVGLKIVVGCRHRHNLRDLFVTSWNTRRCPGFKIKWKKSTHYQIIMHF
jgi:hypothetical protein